jgi:hypothetical protein
MRCALFLGLIFLHTSLLVAQPDHLAKTTDLPAWMAELITGEATKTTLKPSGKPVHTNAFVGTWIMRATGGKRLLYWGDEHRMIIQEVQGMDTPIRTTLVDLQANVSAVLYPNQGVFVGKVRDLYHPQQGLLPGTLERQCGGHGEARHTDERTGGRIRGHQQQWRKHQLLAHHGVSQAVR